jgi:outer membrane protein OmpA-like peptidoglycan-associated protein
MLFSTTRQAVLSLLMASLLLASLKQPVQAQAAAPASNLVDQLVGPETPADIDVAALRQAAADRIQSKADAAAVRRPPIAPQLLKLPQFNFDVVFDPDTSVIRPQSYATIGRLADALSDPKLLPFAFLVIDNTESTGRRSPNLILSQRRADAIRAVLSGTFNISSKRLQALGLGEEQLQDAARPTSPTNARAQIVTLGTIPPPAVPAPVAGSASPVKKNLSASSKKRH